jgi:hypothetical protein
VETVVANAGALVVVVMGLGYIYRLASNHLDHISSALDNLAVTIQDQTEATKELYGWIKGRTERDN